MVEDFYADQDTLKQSLSVFLSEIRRERNLSFNQSSPSAITAEIAQQLETGEFLDEIDSDFLLMVFEAYGLSAKDRENILLLSFTEFIRQFYDLGSQ